MSAATATPSGGLSSGAQWVIDRIEAMQSYYREALMAAVTILQYQNQSRRLRLGRRETPKYMSKRLEDAWARYEATRRHVEWYMKQNALYASSPSHPAIIMPTPQPPAREPSLLAPEPQEQPKASPVPLSAASLLAYDNTNATTQTSQPPISNQPLGLQSQAMQTQLSGNGSITLGGSMNSMGAFPGTTMDTAAGEQAIDFSSLGIGELTDLINSTSDFFPSNGAPNPGQINAGSSGTEMSFFNSGDKSAMEGLTPNTQAETDKLIASLGGMTQSQTNPSGIGSSSMPSTSSGQTQSTNNADVDALLATLRGPGDQANSTGQGGQGGTGQNDSGDGQSGQQEFTFGFGSDGVGAGDVDLSALVGLFSDASKSEQQESAQGQSVPQNPSDSAQTNPSSDPSAAQSQSASISSEHASQTGQGGQQSKQQQQQPQPQPQQSQQPQQPQQQQPETQQQTQQPHEQQTQQPQQQQPTQTQPPSQQTLPDSSQPPAQSAQPAQPAQPSQPSQSSQPSQAQPADFGSDFNMGNMDMSKLQMPDLGNAEVSTNTLSLEGMQGMDGQEYDMNEINLDDFNFGDNGMPNVEGDEFESLFAEFK